MHRRHMLHRVRNSRALLRQVLVSGFTVCGLACQPELTKPTFQDAPDLYWRLELNHEAVTLGMNAPYDTVQLIATPRTITGTALPNTETVRYIVNDTSITIDSMGILRAHSPIRSLKVIASMTVGAITLRDSILVTVNDLGTTLSSITTFSIHPPVGTRLVGSCLTGDGTKQLVPVIVDATGQSLADSVAVVYRSSNSDTTAVNAFTGTITPRCAPGASVWLYATATIYGSSYTDSVEYIVNPSSQGIVNVRTRPNQETGHLEVFFQDTIPVAAGGVVVWGNATFLPLDVVFETPAAAAAIAASLDMGLWSPIISDGSGNIAAFTTDSINIWLPSLYYYFGENYRARRFLVPGTYPYHSALYGTRGVVVVLPVTRPEDL